MEIISWTILQKGKKLRVTFKENVLDPEEALDCIGTNIDCTGVVEKINGKQITLINWTRWDRKN